MVTPILVLMFHLDLSLFESFIIVLASIQGVQSHSPAPKSNRANLKLVHPASA